MLLVLSMSLPTSVVALTGLPLSTMQNVVMVICEDRQGSGAIVNVQKGYVLTAGHVALNIETGEIAKSCRIGYIVDEGLAALSFSSAEVVYAIYDYTRESDFAILKINNHIAGPGAPNISGFQSYEFTSVIIFSGSSCCSIGISGSGSVLVEVCSDFNPFTFSLSCFSSSLKMPIF